MLPHAMPRNPGPPIGMQPLVLALLPPLALLYRRLQVWGPDCALCLLGCPASAPQQSELPACFLAVLAV